MGELVWQDSADPDWDWWWVFVPGEGVSYAKLHNDRVQTSFSGWLMNVYIGAWCRAPAPPTAPAGLLALEKEHE